MSGFSWNGAAAKGTNVYKGVIDPSLAANLPPNPKLGERWAVADGTTGSFENSALLSPQGYPLTAGDGIEWNGSVFVVRESGSDVWITGGTITGINDLAIADGGTGASDAPTARSNLDVDSKAEVDAKIDADIVAHNAVTTAHGISAFGATLVNDASSTEARATLRASHKNKNPDFSDVIQSGGLGFLIVGRHYLIDTASIASSGTLPSAASIGDTIGFFDYAGNSSANNITIARNGHRINGVESDLVVNLNGACFKLVYAGAIEGWCVCDFTEYSA